MPSDLTAIVPTIGRSELLAECLRRLRSDGGRDLEIVVVAQGGFRLESLAEDADRVETLPENLGFTGACNHALARTARELVALINDDLLIEPGWVSTLLEGIRADRSLGAVQGLNLQLERPELIDGFGIGWNRFWRPVQLGSGAPRPEPAAPSVEIFGVSATAAIYRASSLRDVSSSPSEIFDLRLSSYYEDVDLAVRLRQKGWDARAFPGAVAFHQGSESSRGRKAELQRLLVSNRLLVSARLFGGRFWRTLPLLFFRDAVEILRAVGTLNLACAAGAVQGWLRAIRLARHFARSGPSAIAREELERFQVTSAAVAASKLR